MQADEERKGYILTYPAFILLRFPIKGEVADGAEGARGQEDGGEEAEVDIVPQIDPDEDEGGEVRHCDGRVDVVEGLACLWSRYAHYQYSSSIDDRKTVVVVTTMLTACQTEVKGKVRKKTHGQEEIADIMRNIHRQAHIREMKTIAQPDQRQRHHMMSHQLLEIFPGLLELQTEHDRLLRPIARLQEIISLEDALVAPVREAFKHPRRVEIPHRRPAHHV